MIEISVVSPVYRSATLVKPFVSKVVMALQQLNIDYEIILVDDGSPDDSWNAVLGECEQNSRVRGISLSRNFGQHYAISAGLDVASGKWIVVMDSDLQDMPEEILPLYQRALEGYDIVLCRRKQRTDGWIKRFFSALFYRFLSFITGKKIDASIANFGIYSHKVINVIVQMRESIRYFPMMVLWVGFKSSSIEVLHGERGQGKSNYNFRRLLRLGLDVVLSYSDKPLEIVAATGCLISLATAIAGVVQLYRYFNHAITVQGYTSLLLSIWFLCGLIIATLGIVGLYVGKTFQGIKNRPLYIARKTINLPDDKS
ncbi:glycosyltransferase [Segetibacter sp. 3557_3]|uniref:glycosyltransferase family 2 protein n=1 Tax=Segetibacter sp. 3557_3 TaxID=2547429 RepID=UPI001058BAA5|nr:glycosyltransferase family 2 protein [Segetibacter sp. 3557_3]TDH27807.1 glycosyltransferase [Segetibacter sp. 3557_3]